MLKSLTVKNLAIVSELCFEPGETFSVLTGETGAGKSIIVNSLSLLLGGRGTSDLIRDGADNATIESVWEISAIHPAREFLKNYGIKADSEILIKRTISADGKSRFYINGSAVTANMLKELAGSLMNISGQREHISLLDPETHLQILDAYGGYKTLLSETAEAFHRFKSLDEKYKRLLSTETERLSRMDFIRFQLEEIKKVAPKEGEEEALATERERLRNIGRLSEAVETALSALSEGDDKNVQDLLGRAATALERGAKFDPKLTDVCDALEEAQAAINDAVATLNHYRQDLSDEPGRLDDVEARLFELSRLFKRFGGDYASFAARKTELEKELDSIDYDEEALERLKSEVETAEDKYKTLSTKLRKERKKAAKKLADAVNRELCELGFFEDAFSLQIAEGEVGERGCDKVEFIFAPNPGEPPRPLAKIASGGELSRFLLGVKIVLASSDTTASYVFDEVDSGIGGAIAERIGERLKKLSETRQVVCITHLAPIAARAVEHFRISKEIKDGRTFSAIERLNKEEREREIARMLSGAPQSKTAREHAREILKGKIKRNG
ncbi:MAG: DNA repair protein RecN [Myxococcota bacterium]